LQLLSLLGVGEEQAEAVASCRLLLEAGVQQSGGVRLWEPSMSNHRLDRVIKNQRYLFVANLAAVVAFVGSIAVALAGM